MPLQLVKDRAPFERAVVSRDEALAMFEENKFKVRCLALHLQAQAQQYCSTALHSGTTLCRRAAGHRREGSAAGMYSD